MCTIFKPIDLSNAPLRSIKQLNNPNGVINFNNKHNNNSKPDRDNFAPLRWQ